MGLRSFLLGRAEFQSPSRIIELVDSFPQFRTKQESTGESEGLLIFQTSKQQTWLVATRTRLCCVLDDIGKGFTRVQWAIPKEKIVTGSEVTLPIRAHEMREVSENTGLVDIGEHKNWLFSKKLFASETIESRTRRMISGQMIM